MRRDDGLVVVEDTISLGQRGALGEVDANAALLDNGAGRRKKRKRNSEQAGFAEHCREAKRGCWRRRTRG